MAARRHLAAELLTRDAIAILVDLPQQEAEQKVGLDDFIFQNVPEAAEQLITKAPTLSPWPASRSTNRVTTGVSVTFTKRGMIERRINVGKLPVSRLDGRVLLDVIDLDRIIDGSKQLAK